MGGTKSINFAADGTKSVVSAVGGTKSVVSAVGGTKLVVSAVDGTKLVVFATSGTIDMGVFGPLTINSLSSFPDLYILGNSSKLLPEFYICSIQLAFLALGIPSKSDQDFHNSSISVLFLGHSVFLAVSFPPKNLACIYIAEKHLDKFDNFLEFLKIRHLFLSTCCHICQLFKIPTRKI